MQYTLVTPFYRTKRLLLAVAPDILQTKITKFPPAEVPASLVNT